MSRRRPSTSVGASSPEVAVAAAESRFHDQIKPYLFGTIGASLDYGFKTTFSNAERKQLARLHSCQSLW